MDARRKRLFSKIAKLGGLAGAVATVVPAIYIGLRSYTQQMNVFFPKRKAVAVSLAESGIARAEPASFRVRELSFHGWYAPPLNRAAVILVHGAGGDRSSLVVEARALTKAGFGILSFDLPGHGESDGEIHWSGLERDALRGAVDWLATREGVDRERVGALGFSLGGYVLAQEAARDPRLRAVVFAGTPSDPVAQVRFQHRRWGFLSEAPALVALRRNGMDLDVRARDFVQKIAPRPVLFVTGTHDGTVPRSMAEELYATAREPKELFVIEGAGHGDYEATAPGRYSERIVTFFERTLGR